VRTPWKGDGEWHVDFADGGGFGALALLIAFVVVATIAVSAVVTSARAGDARAAARRAAWLAVIGAASLAVFWTGVPPVLAGGAAGLAAHTRRRSAQPPTAAWVALVLAPLTIACALYLAVTG
jgi:hypothetical protein